MKKALSLFLVLFMLMGIFSTLILLRQRQEIRKGAAGGNAPLIIPQPQLANWDTQTTFSLNAETKVVTKPSLSPNEENVVNALIGYIHLSTGLNLARSTTLPNPVENVIVIGTTADANVISALSPWPTWNQYSPKVQGSLLAINSKVVVIGGFDILGSWYGAQTLRQMLEQQHTNLSAVFIYDYPNVLSRALHLRLEQNSGDGRESDYLIKFIPLFMAKYKYNQLYLFTEQKNFQYFSHPELSNSLSMTQAEARAVVDFARTQMVDVYPMIQTLGHQDAFILMGGSRSWIVNNTVCLKRAGALSYLKDLINEQMQAFDNPKIFGISAEGESNIQSCSGNGPADYIYHVNTLDSYIKSKGATTLAWADPALINMGVYGGTGKVNQDVITAFWRYNVGGLFPALENLKSKGYQVYAVPAAKYTNAFINIYDMAKAAKSYSLPGYMTTTWMLYDTSTLTDPNVIKSAAGVILGAHYSWNGSADPPSHLAFDPVAIATSLFRQIATAPTPYPTPTPGGSPTPTPTPTPGGSPTPTPTPTPICPDANNPLCFDCNSDHAVNVLDFACFKSNYGKSY